MRKFILAALFLLFIIPTVQAGSKDVEIIGQPVDVHVTNDGMNPVTVINAGEPFQEGTIVIFSAGTTGGLEPILTVPSDKRVVVEFVSARGFTSTDRGMNCNILGFNSQEGHFLQVQTVPRGSDFAKIISQPVLLFLGPDHPVQFGCNFGAPSLANDVIVSVTISGRLFDID